MSEEELDLNEAAARKAIITMRASTVLKPVVKSMIDPETSDFIDTPEVSAIRNSQAFAVLYQNAINDLHNLGLPSIPVTPARVIDYMLEHKAAGLHVTMPNHLELANAILAQAEAKGIKPTRRVQKSSPEMKPLPVAEEQSGLAFPEPKLSHQEIRLADAKAASIRVLFDKDGNLKPGGVLTQPAIVPAYEIFKADMDERIGTSRPIAEEVFAKNFIDTVLGDETHALHETLRESILRAAKKLPPETPARAINSLSDEVRVRIAAGGAIR